MEDKEKVLFAALAGLLHDVGKFAERAGVLPSRQFIEAEHGQYGYHALLSDDFLRKFAPEHLQAGLRGVKNHHNPQDDSARLVHLADSLAITEHHGQSVINQSPPHDRLIPILSEIELETDAPSEALCHMLAPLEIKTTATYPHVYGSSNQAGYSDLWDQFIGELQDWKNDSIGDWQKQDLQSYFVTILALLRKYLWCVPATNSISGGATWTNPDVSLYDHLRLTSAIAACQAYDDVISSDAEDAPVAVILRGDFSGIQSFIYRITRPEAETEHVAKRLRGRSYYLGLLADVCVEWILREIGLPSTCALYIGGGRFDLLLPLKARTKITELTAAVEKWILEQFQGELGLQIALCQVSRGDFSDMREVYQVLDERLEISKRQKWHREISNLEFYQTPERLWHVCRICQVTPLSNPGTCPQCSLHEKIGRHLPHVRYLVYCYGLMGIDWPSDQVIEFPGSPFNIMVVIVRHDDDLRPIISAKIPKVIYQINGTDSFLRPGVAGSFRFLANEAPRAQRNLRITNTAPIQSGDVLSFEVISEFSEGAKRIGIFKADVDRLGLAMSEGLFNEKKGQYPTISRIASMSSALDLFFAGHLNRICWEVSQDWQKNAEHEQARDINGLFYIMYSGGDDLLVIGPWDAILVLAKRVNEEFARYSGMNPNLTLSAGYVQVRPRYPTQKFAELVDEAETTAKNAGRNRIAAFGHVMNWRNPEALENSFEWLYEFATELTEEVKSGKLPRSTIADLGEIHRQHHIGHRRWQNPMWTPRLYYVLSRRLNSDLLNRIGKKIIKVMRNGNILVPVSIVSLATRKE